MEPQILHTIQSYHDFSPEACANGMGIEFQDFTELNLFEGAWCEEILRYERLLTPRPAMVAMHGPFVDLKPFSYDGRIRHASQWRYTMAMNVASLLDVDAIIFHSQLNPFLTNPWILEADRKTHAEFLLRLLDEFPSFHGKIYIENVYENDPKELRLLMEEIDHPRIGVNLDVGHANLTTTPLRAWLSELKPWIGYCHLQMNGGEKDEHRAPTEEEMQSIARTFFQVLGKMVPLSLEYFTKDPLGEKERLLRIIHEVEKEGTL